MVERSRTERKGTHSSLQTVFLQVKKAPIWRGVCRCLPRCEKDDAFGSLELIMDFRFYKLMLKLVMHSEKKMYGQGFKL